MADCQILHGKSEELSATIAGPIHAIITDPPYGMAFVSGSAQGDGKKFAKEIANDNDIDLALNVFLLALFPLVEQTPDDAEMYVFCRWDLEHRFRECINEGFDGFEVENMLIWDKDTVGMGDLEGNWGYSYECILYAKKGRRKLNKRLPSIIRVPMVRPGKNFHPSQKPVELLEVLIKNSTAPGELVVDPFAGSGSTIVAAHRTDRRGIGIEMDADYVARIKSELGQQYLDLGDIA